MLTRIDLTRAELRDLAVAATAAHRAELALYDPDGNERSYTGEHVTGAQVRAVLEALQSAGYRIEKAAASLAGQLEALKIDFRRVYGREPSCDPGDDGKGLLPALTPEEVAEMPRPNAAQAFAEIRATHGHLFDSVTDEDIASWRGHEPPASTVTVPLRWRTLNESAVPAQRPEPKAADAGDLDTVTPTDRMTAAQAALYRRVAPLLQRLAREGYMPTKAEYNAQRGDLPVYEHLIDKLGCKWSELAAWLGLRVQSRYHGPGKGNNGVDNGVDGAGRETQAKPEPPAVPRKRGTAVLDSNGLVQSVTPIGTGSAGAIIHRAPDGGVTRIVPRADGSQAHSLPSAFAARNSDGREAKPAYSTGE